MQVARVDFATVVPLHQGTDRSKFAHDPLMFLKVGPIPLQQFVNFPFSEDSDALLRRIFDNRPQFVHPLRVRRQPGYNVVRRHVGRSALMQTLPQVRFVARFLIQHLRCPKGADVDVPSSACVVIVQQIKGCHEREPRTKGVAAQI